MASVHKMVVSPSEECIDTNRAKPTVILVSRDKKKHKALERTKMDIRARCVTCICLILTCAVGLGIVSIVLVSETNSGLLSSEQSFNGDRIDGRQRDCDGMNVTGQEATAENHTVAYLDRPSVSSVTRPAYSEPSTLTDPGNSTPLTVDDSTSESFHTPAGQKLLRTDRPSHLSSSAKAWNVLAGLLTTQKMTPTGIPDLKRCIPVRSSVPSCVILPYNYTTVRANHTANYAIDSYFFDPNTRKCHDDWIFFLCAYILPECQTAPPSGDWKPRCLCPDFNATIFDTKRCAQRELGTNGLERDKLSCAGRADPIPPNCLQP